MNRQLTAPSKLARTVAAAAAILMTTLVVTSNFGLADHYTLQAEAAHAKTTQVAKH